MTYLTIPGKFFIWVKRLLLTTGEVPLIPSIVAVTSTREYYGVLTWKSIHRLKKKVIAMLTFTWIFRKDLHHGSKLDSW